MQKTTESVKNKRKKIIMKKRVKYRKEDRKSTSKREDKCKEIDKNNKKYSI